MVTTKAHDQQQQQQQHNYQGNINEENIENFDSDSGLEVVEEPTLRPSDLVRGNHNRSMSIISGELLVRNQKRKFRSKSGAKAHKINLSSTRVSIALQVNAKYRELCKKCLHVYLKF